MALASQGVCVKVNVGRPRMLGRRRYHVFSHSFSDMTAKMLNGCTRCSCFRCLQLPLICTCSLIWRLIKWWNNSFCQIWRIPLTAKSLQNQRKSQKGTPPPPPPPPRGFVLGGGEGLWMPRCHVISHTELVRSSPASPTLFTPVLSVQAPNYRYT